MILSHQRISLGLHALLLATNRLQHGLRAPPLLQRVSLTLKININGSLTIFVTVATIISFSVAIAAGGWILLILLRWSSSRRTGPSRGSTAAGW